MIKNDIVEILVDSTEIDNAINKVEKLNDLLERSNELMHKLTCSNEKETDYDNFRSRKSLTTIFGRVIMKDD